MMHSRINFFILLLFYLSFKRSCYSAAALVYIEDRYSPVIFQVTGNVYPMGYYYVTMNIGNPPKPYWLDLDTGSDLTWIQCDAPCIKCIDAPHKPYEPKKGLVACKDPLCASVHWPEKLNCYSPNDECHYEVEYADQASSLGLMVQDWFRLDYINGRVVEPRLAFGCGYNQKVHGHAPFTDGVLGLGLGKASILHQLKDLGVTKNIVAHCLGSHGDGYLSFGGEFPSKRIIWTPMLTTNIGKHYYLGTAELYVGDKRYVGGKRSAKKGLPIVFDSGSTYTYFSAEAYKALLSRLMNDIEGKNIYKADEDDSLPVCWKGPKTFESIKDVEYIFKPIMLVFSRSKNARFQIGPKAYLIISKYGNVCLGILDGSEVGLESINLIGDISFQDKIIIYDNEKKLIGWAPDNCIMFPLDNIIDDIALDFGDCCQPCESERNILQVNSDDESNSIGANNSEPNLQNISNVLGDLNISLANGTDGTKSNLSNSQVVGANETNLKIPQVNCADGSKSNQSKSQLFGADEYNLKLSQASMMDPGYVFMWGENFFYRV